MRKRHLKIIAFVMAACMTVFSVPSLADTSSMPMESYSYMQNDTLSSLALSEKAYSKYFLGIGDSIDVHLIVGDNALALDYNFMISSAGTIFFPNIGPIKLSGLKMKEAEDEIRRQISKKFTEPFKISVVLRQPRMTRVYFGSDNYMPSLSNLEKFVYLYGEVSRPGRYNYLPGKTLSDYINLAGGPSGKAILSNISVTRNQDNKISVYHVNADDILFRGIKTNDMSMMEGDIIQVPANWFYFSDFSSFANLVLLSLTLYATVSTYARR